MDPPDFMDSSTNDQTPLQRALAMTLESNDLPGDVLSAALESILDGEAPPEQIAALLTALRIRGETREHLFAAASTIRRRTAGTPLQGPLLDTCGTGGDGLGTINVSSAVSIIAAAAGIRVAKHGNRAVSGKTGSADVLKAMGVPVELSMEQAASSLDQTGYAFFFAPQYHATLRHVASVRLALGFRTLFNLLGPLVHPAGATHQLVGVFDPARTEDMAWTLGKLGLHRAVVVSGEDGMDELTLTGPSRVSLFDGGGVSTRTMVPQDFGLVPARANDLCGVDAQGNARQIEAIFGGEVGPKSDLIQANAAMALWAAGVVDDPKEGMERVRTLLVQGVVLRTLERIRAFR